MHVTNFTMCYKPIATYTMSQATTARPIYAIAAEIKKVWGAKLSNDAKPYLSAMQSLTTINDRYGFESAKSMISYFLCNASGFRGEDAKRIKIELKQIAGIK